ncbi:MAG TPA: hypothetical protein VF486_26640 [Actinomycetes bacterium]
MGKVIVSTHVTVDGVVGPSPGDWASFDDEGERFKFDQLLAADAFLLGRKVYQGLASAWPTITDRLADEVHFWVQPVVWGDGERAFGGRRVRLRPLRATVFDSGVALLCYRPAPDQHASAAS